MQRGDQLRLQNGEFSPSPFSFPSLWHNHSASEKEEKVHKWWPKEVAAKKRGKRQEVS